MLSTPDGRYFVVKGQLWRCTNPALDEATRQQVQHAKVALGERGPVWWQDGSPDYNRCQVGNTPYASWFEKHLDTTSQ